SGANLKTHESISLGPKPLAVKWHCYWSVQSANNLKVSNGRCQEKLARICSNLFPTLTNGRTNDVATLVPAQNETCDANEASRNSTSESVPPGRAGVRPLRENSAPR